MGKTIAKKQTFTSMQKYSDTYYPPMASKSSAKLNKDVKQGMLLAKKVFGNNPNK